MYNDFVIIGPPDDPAGEKDMTAVEALKTIRSKESAFVSRGDNSGTHAKELGLWENAGAKEPWYIQTGQGMLNAINIAAERNTYTLTDRKIFIKYEANHDGNPPLFNQYSVIAVNPERCQNVKYDLAMKFIEWMLSDEAQRKIADFRLEVAEPRVMI